MSTEYRPRQNISKQSGKYDILFYFRGTYLPLLDTGNNKIFNPVFEVLSVACKCVGSEAECISESS